MIRYKSNTRLGAAYTATIIYTLYIACTVLTALAQNVREGLQKVIIFRDKTHDSVWMKRGPFD